MTLDERTASLSRSQEQTARLIEERLKEDRLVRERDEAKYETALLNRGAAATKDDNQPAHGRNQRTEPCGNLCVYCGEDVATHAPPPSASAMGEEEYGGDAKTGEVRRG